MGGVYETQHPSEEVGWVEFMKPNTGNLGGECVTPLIDLKSSIFQGKLYLLTSRLISIKLMEKTPKPLSLFCN
ncbi:UNVERIFIED_CONTAM: hypothetical protein BEN50_06505 [Euhalothece sp. KZN 001]